MTLCTAYYIDEVLLRKKREKGGFEGKSPKNDKECATESPRSLAAKKTSAEQRRKLATVSRGEATMTVNDAGDCPTMEKVG